MSGCPACSTSRLAETHSTANRFTSRKDGEEIVILPSFEGAHNALRAVGGYRQGRGAFEVSYDRTKHDGTFLGRPSEATFHVLNFDERVYLLNEKPHPAASAARRLDSLDDDQGWQLSGSELGDGSFRGFGMNTEGGRDGVSAPRVGVSTGYRYRVMWFDYGQRRHPHHGQAAAPLPREHRQRRDHGSFTF